MRRQEKLNRKIAPMEITSDGKGAGGMGSVLESEFLFSPRDMTGKREKRRSRTPESFFRRTTEMSKSNELFFSFGEEDPSEGWLTGSFGIEPT